MQRRVMDDVPLDADSCIAKAGKHQGRALACASFIDIVKYMPPVHFVLGAVFAWISMPWSWAFSALACITFASMKYANQRGQLEHFKGRVLFFAATGRDVCEPEKTCGELPPSAHELRALWLKAQR